MMGAWNANQGDSLTEDRGAAVWVVPGYFTPTINQGQALTKLPMLCEAGKRDKVEWQPMEDPSTPVPASC